MTLRLAPEDIVAQSTSPLLAIADWWERCRLGDLAAVTNGAAFKSARFNTLEDGLPLIRIRDVGQLKASTYYSGDYEDRHLVESGDLLIGMDGDFRIARWTGGRALLNQRVCRLQVHDSDLYCDRFLEYVLQPYLDEIHKVTSSVTVKHLSSRTVTDLPIPLPPRTEQERIVAAIEEHFSRLDAADDSMAAPSRRTAQLLESVLQTELGTAVLPSQPLSDFLTEPLANGRSVPTAEEYGFPVLRLTCLKDGWVDTSESKQGNFGEIDHGRYRVESGDFLISRGNGSLHLVGIGGLVPHGVHSVAYPDTLIRARVDRSRLRPDFLSLIWNSRIVRRQLESQARTTAGIYKVNQSMIGKAVLPAPSPDVQDRIARKLESVRQTVLQLDAEVDRYHRRSASLRRSILSTAFSGRLMPQNPNDESASVLLERIAASRTAKPRLRRTNT